MHVVSAYASEELPCRVAQVAKQTRKKQGYMELLDICLKVKQAKDLQKMLKWVAAQAVRHTHASAEDKHRRLLACTGHSANHARPVEPSWSCSMCSSHDCRRADLLLTGRHALPRHLPPHPAASSFADAVASLSSCCDLCPQGGPGGWRVWRGHPAVCGVLPGCGHPAAPLGECRAARHAGRHATRGSQTLPCSTAPDSTCVLRFTASCN
jgi:hypothetical protein